MICSLSFVDDISAANPDRWRAMSLRYFKYGFFKCFSNLILMGMLYFSPAGAHPSGFFGEEPKGRPGNLFPLLAHMACGRIKESTLKVFGNDYPTQ